jgi:hypothetical protein
MNRNRQLLSSLVVATGLLVFAGDTFATKPAAKPEKATGKDAHQKKAHHQNGKQLLGDKIKTNGRHAIDHKGDVTAEVEVKNGKIVGLHANHAKKGELPVKKYKSSKKMVQADGLSGHSHFMTVQQYEYVDTIWIGYAYIDDYGDEQIYWFPVDMIYDGDTGAVEYVPYY